jgi:hypothetical protein
MLSGRRVRGQNDRTTAAAAGVENEKRRTAERGKKK